MSSAPSGRPLSCASNSISGIHPSWSSPTTGSLPLIAQLGMRRKKSPPTISTTMTSQERNSPLSGVVDMRLPEGAARPRCPATWSYPPTGQHAAGDYEVWKQMLPPPPCPGRELFDDPSCVNIHNLDKAQQAGAGAWPPNPSVNGSAHRDLFDMKPFEDALPVQPPPQSMSIGSPGSMGS